MSSESLRTTEDAPSRMDIMMTTRTGIFQSWIQNIDDFHEVNKNYLQMHKRPGYDHSEFPSDPKRQQELVKVLFEAAQDCSNIFEPEGSKILKRIQQKYYADFEFELVLWPLLMSIRDAQAGKCNIPNYNCSRVSQYNVYGSFTERFDVVYDALKSSKDTVASLFKDDNFKHRLAWRPKSELKKKAENRKIHNQYVHIPIGAHTTLQNDIKATTNGELVDRKGQTHGSMKKRTATLEGRIEETKKQARLSDDMSSPNSATFVDTGNIEIIEETPQQNHTFEAESASQEPFTSLPSLSSTNMEEDVFGQTATSMEGMYSDPFMSSDDSDIWSPFFEDRDSVYPPLDD
ncbi:uncharacterized protein F4807DRAFT_456911 [Annulohypoxylon truncatum]|uniref:uncharacterized protein n=1 Tax=Annulohypoxylon truncatum TaxID=327061 RepID=UPI0020085CEF|nr:uncharacterized protein F4807DRAFT_456911 [Annulohypoxylon truncatum]KAI1213567.1 hypothetical protein F4807DRAFT_456911 [Annulohypoxylon truncatum]